MKQNQQSRQEDELAQRKIERQQMERQHEEERKLRQQEDTHLAGRLHALASRHPFLTIHFILLQGSAAMGRATNPPRFTWQRPSPKPRTQPRPIGRDPCLDQA
jgi:hypothetical protein